MHKARRPSGLHLWCLAALLVSVAGCQQTLPPPAPGSPKLTFAQMQPLTLAVEAIDVEVAYRSPGRSPNVEHRYMLTPAAAFSAWAGSRMRADGTPGLLRIVLLDGQVTRKQLPADTGFKGLITDQQKWRYDGRMHVRAEYHSAGEVGDMGTKTFAEATATGFFTAPEGITLNDLELEMFRLVETMITRIDAEMEPNLREYMPDIIR